MNYYFNDWILNTKARSLCCNDEVRSLEPLAFDVLVELCENAGEIVSTETLLTKYWPGISVSPNSLTRVIAQLRKVLSDDHRAPRYIETVPKVGYRFIADVEVSSNSKKSLTFISESRSRSIVVVAALLVLFSVMFYFAKSPEIKSENITLVIFPLESSELSSGASLSQELLEEFYAVPEVKLRGFLAAERALLKAEDPLSAAISLGATHFVTGRVTKQEQAQDISFYIELLEVQSGNVIWSQQNTRPISEQANWPSEVRSHLLEALVGLPIPSISRTDRRMPDPEAYRLYLEAKYIWLQRGKVPVSKAIYLLKEAVSIDPEFAAAWDSLAAALISWQTYEDVPDSTINDAYTAAQHAIELDPGVSFSYHVLFGEAFEDRRYKEAEGYARQSLENTPNDAMAVYWFSSSMRQLGRMDEAHDYLRRSVELDPTIGVIQADFAISVMHTIDTELGYRKLYSLWEQGMRADWVWRFIHVGKLQLEDLDSVSQWRKEFSLNNADRILVELEIRFARGEKITREELESLIDSNEHSNVDHRGIIYALSYLGEDELLFDYIDSLEKNDQVAAAYVLAALSDRFLNHSRMISYFDRVGLLEYWLKNDIRDICQMNEDRWHCSQYRRKPSQQDLKILLNY